MSGGELGAGAVRAQELNEAEHLRMVRRHEAATLTLYKMMDRDRDADWDHEELLESERAIVDRLNAQQAEIASLRAQAEAVAGAGDEMEGIQAALRGSRGTHNPHLYTGENARRDAWWRGNAQVWRLVDETARQHAESAYNAGMLTKNRLAAPAAADAQAQDGAGAGGT